MKLFITILFASLFIGGCSDSHYDEQGRYVYSSNTCSFKYVMFDGHEYVQWVGGGGLTHSPKCQCISNKKGE